MDSSPRYEERLPLWFHCLRLAAVFPGLAQIGQKRMSTNVPGIDGIFISYRRADTIHQAGWLFERLAAHYGPDRVFKDLDSIRPGDEFAITIREALESCEIFLAVIGPRWLSAKNRAGRRLDDPDDLVRLEIEAALTRHIRVIPVLVDGAKIPPASELPPSLAELVTRQTITLSPERFSADTDRLLKALDAMLAETAAPPPSGQPPKATPESRDPAKLEEIPQPEPASPPSSQPSPGRPRRLGVIALVSAVILAAAGLVTWRLTQSPAARNAQQSRPLGLSSRPYVPQKVAFSPDGTAIAVAAIFRNRIGPGQTYLFSAATGAKTAVLRGPGSKSGVNTVSFSPDGRTLAVGDGNGTTYLWTLASRTITGSLPDPGNTEGVESVAFSPAGRLLAAGDYDGSTYLWNVSSRKLIAVLHDPGPRRSTHVDSVAFNPAGTVLAVGDNNGSTYLWSLTTRALTATLTDPRADHLVGSIAFSPDGTTLAAGDDNGSTYLWNLTTRKIIATLSDPGREGVDAIAFSPDGTTVAAGDNDGSTYLWDLTTRTKTETLPDPGNEGVNTVAFSPDGRTLAAGDNDASTYLWNLKDHS